MSLLLGVDVGTSGTKAVLTDERGAVLASAQRSHAVAMPRPGWFEQDAETWWAEVAGLAAELLAGRSAADVAAVCCSGMGPCTVVADRDGRPLRPAILYGIDSRAGEEIAELEAELGADQILSRCGSPLTSQAVGPKLRWIERREPDVWEQARMLLMPSSLAVHRLTGEYVLDHHSASQCAPMYDLGRGEWDLTWAERVAPGLPRPRLAWPAEAAGAVTARAAAATGLREGTPVATGTVDAWAEALSVGIRGPGDLMLMYGSTMFLVLVGDGQRPDPRLWLTRWALPGHTSRAAGLATSGLVLDWYGTLVGRSLDDLATEAAAAGAGAGGLLALPYFAGERTPLFDPQARGLLAGLHLGHGRGHLYRAFLEGTAYAVRHNLEAMADAGDRVERAVAVGGGIRTGLWMQVVSDVTGLEQQVPDETVGACYGDALMAAMCAGLADTTTDWSTTRMRVVPATGEAARYAEGYGMWRDLYRQTSETTHRIAELQEAHG
jgi:xylulokinase